MTQHPTEITINKALLQAAIATAAWRRKKQQVVDARTKAQDAILIAHEAGASLREIAARLKMPLVTLARFEEEARKRAADTEEAS